jgi:molecular chaperone HtpG
MTDTIERFDFQAESRQLLDLMIHSVYSHKEIFLRELISNASDALDRRRFEAVSNPDALPDGTELEVWLEADTDARTLTIRDSGIGMSREEVIDLIGTIAKSGTREFTQKLKESKESDAVDLIGQFGVGFYSGFMVADKMTLVTRKAGEDAGTKWESEGDGSYTLEEVSSDAVGTAITLHLKDADAEDGMDDFAEEWKLREIVKKYSDFVAYPIKMNVSREEIEKDDEGKPVEGAEAKTVIEAQTLNSMKAIWLRGKDDVTDDEYAEFYKHIAHDWTAPLATIRANIEGTLEYKLLLFIPEKAPFDLYMREGRRGIQLYVKRVFIMDDCDALVPEYMRWVRGVVDSEDLSLNISREILQQDRQIQRMQKGLVGKVLDHLKQMRDDDAEKFTTFWGEFGRVLKEGIYADPDVQNRILELCRFDSTMDDGEQTSLQSYIDRMKDGQETIYYMAGETREAVEQSPHLEAFKDKGFEILILADPVDEIWTQSVFEYEGKKLQSIGRGAVDLDDDGDKEEKEKETQEKTEAHASLIEMLKGALSDEVKDVRLSSRLTSSPACLVVDEGDLSPQLEQIMRASNQPVPESKRILELNPTHPLLEKMQGMYDANKDDAQLKDYAELLYGQAALAEGQAPPNPGRLAKLLAELMVRA